MKANLQFVHLSIFTTPVAVGFVALGIVPAFAQNDDPRTLQKANPVYSELTKAPPKARAKRNPFEGDPTAVAAGRRLFAQHCAECHGSTAIGGKKGPNLRAEEVQNATPGTLFWILTNGVVRQGMPVWSKLPEPQRWQIVTYLKSLGLAEKSPDGTNNLGSSETQINNFGPLDLSEADSASDQTHVATGAL